MNTRPNPATPVHAMKEEGDVSDQETGIPEQESDQQQSKEQNYWETVKDIQSFMEWHQVPEFESSASSKYDNPFVGPRTQPTGKISVKIASDDSLCLEIEKLNLTLIEGYPTCSTDTNGLSRDKFIKVLITRSGMMCNQKRKIFPRQKFTTGLINQQNSLVLSPELLDSSYLLDHWPPGL